MTSSVTDAVRVDLGALGVFLDTRHVDDDPLGDTWADGIKHFDVPGSAEFLRDLEPLIFAMQETSQGLVLIDELGVPDRQRGDHTGSLDLELITDSSGYAGGFILILQLRSGARLCTQTISLTQLADRRDDSNWPPALSPRHQIEYAVTQIAALASAAYRLFLDSARQVTRP